MRCVDTPPPPLLLLLLLLLAARLTGRSRWYRLTRLSCDEEDEDEATDKAEKAGKRSLYDEDRRTTCTRLLGLCADNAREPKSEPAAKAEALDAGE